MAKKKTVWKTAASVKLNRDPLEALTENLDQIASGKHRCLRDEETLYNELGAALDRVEKLPEVWGRLAALDAFFATDARVLDSDGAVDTFQGLYNDAAGVFIANAKTLIEGLDVTPEEYLFDILTGLVHGYTGPCGRESLLAQVDSFLSKEQVRALCEALLTDASAQPEPPVWLGGVEAMADAILDPVLYERAVLTLTPEPSNEKMLEIANAYLLAEQADTALAWIAKVQDPDEHDREEALDLRVACLVQQGKKGEAVELARTLYAEFANVFNLARLCQLLPVAEYEPLLNAFAAQLEPGIDAEYAHLLLSLERTERLGEYLAAQRAAPVHEQPEDLEALAERLVGAGHEEWAEWVRTSCGDGC